MDTDSTYRSVPSWRVGNFVCAYGRQSTCTSGYQTVTYIFHTQTKKPSEIKDSEGFYGMPKAGLEPARLAAPPPQDGVSANSTTSAKCYFFSGAAGVAGGVAGVAGAAGVAGVVCC